MPTDALPPRSAAGAVAPSLCVLHCLAAPALVAVAPGLVENASVELVLTGASLAMGVMVTREGVRVHGERRIWALVAFALLLFLTKSLTGMEGAPERGMTVLASLCVLAAVAWDAHLRRRCACVGCGCARMKEASSLVGRDSRSALSD